MRMPKEQGPFHIVGIGGIGMSAIAHVMLELGYEVQGSDLSDSMNLKRLEEMGATTFVGHAAENIDKAGCVIISTAVKPGNPERDEALKRGIPVIRRAEVLTELIRHYANISVTGTHGKTTITSLTAHVLVQGGIDPTVITGGIVNDWASNARIGKGEWMVVEADESDGTFLKLPSQIGIIANIDPEHLDYYGDFDTLKEAFSTFVDKIPFYGLVVAGIDNENVRTIVENHKGGMNRRQVLTYGEHIDADLRLENLRGADGYAVFDVALGSNVPRGERRLEGVRLPLPGVHNASNALASMAVALELGMSDEKIMQSLENFGGVYRRFTRIGDWNGVAFYDDYAHHPVEIENVLKAARSITKGRVIAVKQPHRYSRVADLFDEFAACFGEADKVIVAPVYEAGEKPIEGITHGALAEAIRKTGHEAVYTVEGQEDLTIFLGREIEPGDLVICLGAGDISRWGHALPVDLEKSFPGGNKASAGKASSNETVSKESA
ncbi:MAG: UDP-N-acetylmuramate--L-alanine ligase [Hyphomicrobiaceae bacterium]|nr:UDP-N-acetylmuramate--L-alanine ligase [Hyphomicrobiaceae bacterium]